MPTHPACGTTFPGGSRHGHCAGCCRTFVGLAAFDKHRQGEHDTGRYCELTEKHWQDERGYWHTGQRLTDEEKRKLWG